MLTATRLVILLALALPFQLGSGCRHHKATQTMTTMADFLADAPLMVKTRNGAIDVTADETVTDVSITAQVSCAGDTQSEAEQRLAAFQLNVTRDTARTLIIEPIFPGGHRNGDGASLEILLPGALNADLQTSNGRVNSTNLAGELVVRTSNGSITIEGHDGSADVKTSNGRINASHVAGSLKATTSNGTVDARLVDGPVEARSSNGNIVVKLDSDEAGPVNLTTSNGSIKARVGPAFTGNVAFQTSNGSISVTDDANRVTARTLTKRSGNVMVGEGGKESKLQTSNGRIEFIIEQDARLSTR